jgi:hypothetical protein
MLWSSVPQLRWHVARQVLVTYLCLAALAALFWYQPTIVRFAHGQLFGSGFVPSDYEAGVLSNYFSHGWWSLLIAWATLEVGGFWLVWRYKASPTSTPSFRRASSA